MSSKHLTRKNELTNEVKNGILDLFTNEPWEEEAEKSEWKIEWHSMTKELRTWGFKSRWGLYIKLYKGAEWEEAGVLYTVDGEIYPDTGEFEDLIYGG